MTGDARNPMRHLWRIPAEIVVGIYIVVDSLVAPLFRPAMRWLSSLRIIQHIEKAIAGLPAYVILVMLVIPFAVAELAKAYAVVLIGTGHLKTGVAIFIAAYIVSIMVCERIFHAGKERLMTIGWFARLFRWAMDHKDRLLAWFRTTEIWRVATGIKQKVRLMAGRLKALFTGRSSDGVPDER